MEPVSTFTAAKWALLLLPFLKKAGLKALHLDDGFLKDLVEKVGDLAGDKAKEKIEAYLKTRPDVTRDLLDQHLVRHTGAVLGRMVRRYAREKTMEKYRDLLNEAADAVPGAWENYLAFDDDRMPALRGEAFIQLALGALVPGGLSAQHDSAAIIAFFRWAAVEKNLLGPLMPGLTPAMSDWITQHLSRQLLIDLCGEEKNAEPAWREAMLRLGVETHAKLDRIEHNQSVTASQVNDLHHALVPRALDVHAQLDAYARTILEKLSPVPLTQILNTGDAVHVVVQQVFTPLQVREVAQKHIRHIGHAKELTDWDGREDQHTSPTELRQKKEAVADFLRSSSPKDAVAVVDDLDMLHHILLGEPGGGKTLLSRHFVTAWARRWLASHSLDGSDPIQIYVELKNYARALENGHVHDLFSYLASENYPYGTVNVNALGEFYVNGYIRIILDGLDEVLDPRLKQRVIEEIKDDPCLPYQFIVTSRIADFDPLPFQMAKREFMNLHGDPAWENKWVIHRIEPLAPSEQNLFIERYHAAFFPEEKERQFRIQRLRSKLQDFHRLAELAGTPLLLTLLCLVNRDPALPETRTELYEQAAELLLHNWDFFHFQHQDIQHRDHLPPLQKTEKHAIMRRLAWLLMMGKPGSHANDDGIPCEPQHLSANLFPTASVEEAVRDVLRELTKANPENYVALLPQLLVERNSVLCPATEGNHSFIHRTFLEFYAAWAWVEEEIPWNDAATTWKDQLWPAAMTPQQRFDALYRPHWQDSVWRVILILHCGRLKPSYAEKLLRHLLTLADDLQAKIQPGNGTAQNIALLEQSQPALLLAAEACSETPQRGRMPALLDDLQARLQSLATFRWAFRSITYEQDQRNTQRRQAAVRLAAQLPVEKTHVQTWLQELSRAHDQPRETLEASLRELAALWGVGEIFEAHLHHLLLESQTSDGYRHFLLRQIDKYWGQPSLSRAFHSLAGLPDLTVLYLSGCTGLVSLADMRALRGLRTLDLQGCTGLRGADAWSGLTALVGLKNLNLSNCTGLESLPDMSPICRLRTLDLKGCTGLRGKEALRGLATLVILEKLDLSGCTGLESLPDLSALRILGSLDLGGCTGLHGAAALSGLTTLTGLEKLNLSSCTGLKNLPDLSALRCLSMLNLRNCTGLHGTKSLRGLVTLAGLKTLDLHGCTGLESLPDLSALRSLRELDLNRCCGLKDLGGLKQQLHPECEIIGPDGKQL